MAEFINTVDVLGEQVVMDGLISRTLTEYRDNRVKKAAGHIFGEGSGVKSVDIPNATYASFRWNTTLTDVNVPLLDINGGQHFTYCSALTKLCLPATTSGQANSFYGLTALRILDLPKCGFLLYAIGGTPNLIALILRKTDSIAVLRGGTPGEPIANGTGYIYVPAALIGTYKTATNWSNYADQFRALEDYTVDGTITGELDESKI